MKIGIVTIVDPTPNYGNKLQNYAVEQIFAGMGWQSVTLAPCRQNRTIPLAVKYAARWCLGVVGVHSFSPEIRALYRRMFAFRRFDQTHLHIREDLCRGTVRPEQYDFFSIGSDQVWNPEQFWDGREDFYLLRFAKPEQKICISPSFGVTQLPENWKEPFRQALACFPRLAVREASGAQIIYDLLGIRPQVLIDPTLMLDAEDWRKISRPPRTGRPEKPYLLTCFLGQECADAVCRAEELSRALDLECRHMLDDRDPRLSGAGPSEYLDLIEHAQAVITDSFHACVFSIIFRRPFAVTERSVNGQPVMSGRIQTLLDKLQISDRQLSRLSAQELMHCDFSNVDTCLAAEREIMRQHIAASSGIAAGGGEKK